MTADRRISPVILSGGAGTRLWPMSRESYPKQFLPLAGRNSLLQDTAARVSDSDLFCKPTVVCNAEHRFLVAQQLNETGFEAGSILLEPIGRNTAPAVAIAAHVLIEDDPEAIMLVLPSDHVIRKKDAFLDALKTAEIAAAQGYLVTFGITPDGPETGYGYIQRAVGLKDIPGAFSIDSFVEKPDIATAEKYIADGAYAWNSGMFMFRAQEYLDTLSKLEPEMAAQCAAAVANATEDLDFLRIDPEMFGACPSNSIDYAVMEHAEKRAIVPADIGWSDVGSWNALLDIGARDSFGNVESGDIVSIENRNSYLRSEGPVVAALGLNDLVVVATEDAVLVMPCDRTQDVKTIVDALKVKDIPAATKNPRVYRPWGHYETVDAGSRFQVKRITVNVGASLSLQKHHHRAEHWIVVNGAARVTRGDDKFVLNENESTYIPPNTVHRLENPGKVPLNLIEVQSGSYLGEDDIVRLEDTYGRGEQD